MARSKRRKKKTRRKEEQAPSGPFHNPFRDQAASLKNHLEKKTGPAPAKAPKPPPDEEEVFLKAMAGITPIDSEAQATRPLTRPKPPPEEDEELEVLARLADLVTGSAPLDIRDTDEYVQGARPGLNPDILHRLSQGLFPVADHLDLHGLTLAQARAEVEGFLTEARRMGQRCVLLIHGRGLSSPEGRPVLKPHLVAWLSRTGLRKHVLAFTSARPYDGGAGAVYVLLKK